MNRKLTFLAATMSLWLAGLVYGADFYVSPQGDDANPGTVEKPLKTLKRAQNAVRALKAASQGKASIGPVTVWLRGGRYELPETFVLGPEDSGQQGEPIVYRAYAKESPVLSGGRTITGWKKVEGDLPGLPDAANGKVWVASVPDARDGKWGFRQLWANGQRLTRARWPNNVVQAVKEVNGKKTAVDGYSAGKVIPGEIQFQVADPSAPSGDALKPGPAQDRWREGLDRTWRTAQFGANDLKAFPGGKLPNDLGKGDVELFAKNGGQWATMRIPVEKVEASRLTTAVPMGCLSYYWGGMRLMTCGMGHIENALSLLDQPGEWYLDRKAGLVYYMPRDGEDPNAMEFVAPKLEQLVCIRGTAQSPVQFVELRGLRLEHAEWPLPAIGYRPMLGCYYGTQLTPLVASASMPTGDVPFKPGSIRPKDEFPEFYLPAAVDVTYARECLLELCRLGHVGASGIGLGEGCRRDRVLGCEVYDAGGNGIHAGLAHGPICAEDFDWKRRDDEPQAIEIASCHVHHTGEMDWGAYGILSSYCRGNRIAHNLVEQQPYSGIAACFTWLVFPTGRDEEVTVEYNHIHHILLKLFDGGGIYTKDGVSAASALRGNLIHDVGGGSFANNGIFLDDGSYGFHIENNIILGATMPIRFNNTSKEKFTWGTNYLGDTNYPRDTGGQGRPGGTLPNSFACQVASQTGHTVPDGYGNGVHGHDRNCGRRR